MECIRKPLSVINNNMCTVQRERERASERERERERAMRERERERERGKSETVQDDQRSEAPQT